MVNRVFVESRVLCNLMTQFGADARHHGDEFEVVSALPHSAFSIRWEDASVANCHVIRDRLVIDLDDYQVTIRPNRSDVDDLRTLVEAKYPRDDEERDKDRINEALTYLRADAAEIAGAVQEILTPVLTGPFSSERAEWDELPGWCEIIKALNVLCRMTAEVPVAQEA